MRSTIMLLAIMLVPALASAQRADAATKPAITPPVWTGVPARTQAQIGAVATALQSVSTQQLANDQGFAPVLGWLPTMGVHWVSDARMVDGKNFDALLPDQLMFSRVNGTETVVGAAYAYLTALGDSARPPTFDGNPPWHEHRNLAPEGQTLVMLHVWFVPSPDGPFAGHNPNLPFWALGLTPPDDARFHREVVRKAAVAVGEVADSSGIFPVLQRRNLRLAAQLAERRQVVRALIPELDAAQKAGNWDEWDRVAERAAAQWDLMREAYLSFAPNAQARERMSKLLDEMAKAGGHHH